LGTPDLDARGLWVFFERFQVSFEVDEPKENGLLREHSEATIGMLKASFSVELWMPMAPIFIARQFA
jgi:hypothetical protein